ncbi:MAG: TetR/AcrR family transcriptional regulator [Oscillospiraceae bacterium]|nr:TetR/AcrR family transcriptional regulator [Oscillospiraceae bacterium]
MAEMKQDRRTRYTCMVIKDALLKLLEEKTYSAITVADICRESEISRGTLYLHYKNISEILDELFTDALQNVNGVFEQLTSAVIEPSCGYPLCVFLRNSRKYRPLFFSNELRTEAINRIMRINEASFVAGLRQRGDHADDTALRALLYFQLNGCLAVCRQTIDLPDAEWERIRSVIDLSLQTGYAQIKP